MFLDNNALIIYKSIFSLFTIHILCYILLYVNVYDDRVTITILRIHEYTNFIVNIYSNSFKAFTISSKN